MVSSFRNSSRSLHPRVVPAKPGAIKVATSEIIWPGWESLGFNDLPKIKAPFLPHHLELPKGEISTYGANPDGTKDQRPHRLPPLPPEPPRSSPTPSIGSPMPGKIPLPRSPAFRLTTNTSKSIARPPP